ncbi:MAG: DoxX family protein [Flaviaesturariibacter sp.]|nr:DoxX family protein [Flaviaesturariibacter sp.]
MKRILLTNPANITALVARLTLGIAVFPHGAQKLLGWFGGYGFNGTMGFLTGGAGLPWIVALLVILIEFFGALFLIAGFATRVAAIGVIANFLGVVITSHLHNGFFMNWYKQPNQGEGLEYFILLFGLAIISLVAGGGKASVDAAITRNNIGISKKATPVFA